MAGGNIGETGAEADLLADALKHLTERVDAMNKSFKTSLIDAKVAKDWFKKYGNTRPLPLGYANQILSVGSKFSHYTKVINSAKSIDLGLHMMGLAPGKFQSPEQAMSFKSRLDRLKNPKLAKHEEYIEAFGSEEAAAEMENAERNAKRREARSERARERREGKKRFDYDQLPEWEREIADLTERYGGGKFGRGLAEKAARLNAYRQFPWMKTLVDAGIIEKKEIPRISKNLARMSKAPIIGKFVRHPSLLPLAALGVATSVLSQSDRANPVVQKWNAAREIFGTPSKAFNRAARLAGFGSMEAVNEFYSRIVSEYGEGNADLIMAHIGSELMGVKPGKERESIMRTFNMNPQMARAAMFMTGRVKPSESDLISAHMSRLQDEITHGFSSDASAAETLRALWLSLGGKWVESRGVAHASKAIPLVKPQNLSIYGLANELVNEILDSMFSKPEKAKAAAESLEAVESAGNSISSVTNGGDTTVSFVIENLGIYASDPQAMTKELIKIGSGRSGLDIMEAFDRKEIA